VRRAVDRRGRKRATCSLSRTTVIEYVTSFRCDVHNRCIFGNYLEIVSFLLIMSYRTMHLLTLSPVSPCALLAYSLMSGVRAGGTSALGTGARYTSESLITPYCDSIVIQSCYAIIKQHSRANYDDVWLTSQQFPR
jgi:hypothetical protein